MIQQDPDRLLEITPLVKEIFNFYPDAIVIYSDNIILYVNPKALELSGASSLEELYKIPVAAFIHYEYQNWLKGTTSQIIDNNSTVDISEFKLIKIDTEEAIYIESNGMPVIYENRKAVFAILRDITERKQIEKEYRKSEERYKKLVDILPDGVGVHCEGKVVLANNHMTKMLGYNDTNEVIGLSVIEFVHPHFKDVVEERMKLAVAEGKKNEFIEEKIIKKDKTLIDVEIASTPFDYEGKNAALVVMRDISERKSNERLIKELAYYDNMTGLPNKTMFNQILSGALKEATQNNELVGVMFIDLDELKNVNDSMGHAVGDELIKVFAERTKKHIRKCDILFRWGGDEFTLILPLIKNKKSIEGIARKIVRAFEEPVAVNNEELYVTPSIGIAVYPSDGDNQEILVKNADIAMNQTKKLGGNSFQFHMDNVTENSLERLMLTNDLRKALANKELFIHYQPIIDTHSYNIVGAEALLRWNNPRLGLVSPLDFIPIAEKTGLIIPIGYWVLETVCEQIKAWQEEGLPLVNVAINLSAKQFTQKDLMVNIKNIISEKGVDPSSLTIEITESTAVKNIILTIKILKQLSVRGINIALDDFGTGYSSLNYLRRFPINMLKIDRSFVKEIASNPEDKMIVSGIIALAKSLKLEVVAEGIETPSQLDVIKENGCYLAQGFLFSKPVSPEDFKKLLPKAWGEKKISSTNS